MAKNDKQTPEKKPRWYKLVGQAFTFTKARDKSIVWLIPLTIVGVTGVGIGIGFLTGNPWFWGCLAFPLSLMAAMFVLTRKFTKAQYDEINGEIGATRAVLGTIKRGWTFPEEPVAVDPKSQDLIFRGIGRPGVVLVAEARTGRIEKLIVEEKKRLGRAIKDVPITVIQVGDREDQVPLAKLVKAVRKLKPRLTRAETGEVERRLAALGGARLPVPKGVDPMKARVNRRDMR